MREIPAMVSSNSSSSSQQPANTTVRSNSKHHHHHQQQQQNQQQQQQSPPPTTLIGDISTLRSRLQELDSNDSEDSPMSRPRSQSAMDGGGREPPQSQSQQSESNLVIQLRKELKTMEAQKAEMELTLMNQMSNLAYENQTTIDGLHARLANSEKMVETLQQEQEASNSQSSSSSSSSPLVDRLRQSLVEERGMRKALEEERDARHQEIEQLKEHRDCAEQECSTLQEGLVKLQQHMDILHSSNVELTAQVKSLQQENEQASGMIDSLESQVSNQQSKLADVERSHQGQMSEIKASYQQRYNQLEKQLLSPTADKNQAGVGHLHRKIAELETENDDLAHQVMDLHEKLESEQSML